MQMKENTKYLLPNDDKEGVRLSKQHLLYTRTAYDGRLIFDKTIKLNSGSQVLDLGTGTGAWIIDLAEQSPESVELVGIDISSRLFPTNPPSNVKFFEISALKLPEEWTGRFDFVNARLLILGLAKDDWPILLSEIYRVLKPGGSVQICEGTADSVHQASIGVELEDLIRKTMMASGHMPDCAMELGALLSKSGLINVRSDPRRFPVGKVAGDDGILGSVITAGVFRSMVKHVVKLGLAETEEMVDKLVDDMVAAWDKGDEPKYRIVYLARAIKPIN